MKAERSKEGERLNVLGWLVNAKEMMTEAAYKT